MEQIPVIDLGADAMVELAQRERGRALALIEAARRQYTAAVVAVLDAQSRRWLARAQNPYRGEIDRIAAIVGRPGTHGLNLSFEWACSSATAPDPAGGQKLWRTLDWPFHGIGRQVVVARLHGAAGPWLNITWPGFVGALTIFAPGRFAAAINQPPLRHRTGLLPVDWLLMRRDIGRCHALPPSHLLRQMAEQARDFAAARELLAATPICAPAIFILSGATAGEGCIIERLEERAVIHDGAGAVANHWLTPSLGPGDRGIESGRRCLYMRALLRDGGAGGAWLRYPVVNKLTRLAVEANASAGRLMVRGYERDGPATAPLFLEFT